MHPQRIVPAVVFAALAVKALAISAPIVFPNPRAHADADLASGVELGNVPSPDSLGIGSWAPWD